MSSIAARDWRTVARSALRWLPGVLVTALAIWLLAQSIKWDEFLAALASVPPGILLLIVALYLVTMLLRALAWQFLLQRKVSPGRAMLAMNEGYFFNNILPFRLGELARAFLLGRRSQLGMFHVLSTIVVERSFDLAIAAGLLLSTLPLALGLEWAEPVAALILTLIVVGLFVLYLAARNREWVEGLIERLAGRWGIVRRFVLPQIHSVLSGFAALTKFEFFAGGFGFLLSSWLLSIARDWMLIRVFAPDAPIWWAALGLSAANMAGAVPSVMAAIGTFELGATKALELVGLSTEAALAYALILHITHLVSSSIIGAYGVSQEGQTFSEIYAEIRRAR